MPPSSRHLRLESLTAVDLPFEVLENAFWRPQAAKLHGRHKESLAAISSREAEKTYQKLRVAWRREETWINHALNALLASLPEAILERAGEELCGVRLDAPQLAKLDSGGIASVTGAPDFILTGSRTCILGESKVAGRHQYDFQQFTKFQLLGAILTCARDPAVRRDATHVVIVPSAEPAKFCADYTQWRPTVRGHRLAIDSSLLKLRDPKSRFRDFDTWLDFVRRTLQDKRVISRCELDPAAIEKLVGNDSAVLVPTFVISWTDLMSRVRAAADGAGLNSAVRAAGQLERLAYGGTTDENEAERLDKFVAKKVVFL